MIFGRNIVAGVDQGDLAKADAGQNNGTLALMAPCHARLNMPSETSTAMLLNRLATMKAALSWDGRSRLVAITRTTCIALAAHTSSHQ